MGAGDEIEVGAVRRDELDTMLAIMCEGFGLPFDAARDIFYADPYFDIENKRVLRVGGRLASCLTIVDTVCRVGEGTARLGGIAGVATPPELRRRGYAGRLLVETVRTLRERGYALSALFPFSYDYYRKYGWELAGFAHRYLTSPRNLPAYPEAQHARLARADDIPALEHLYNLWARDRTLHCLRDAGRWKYLLDYIKQPVVYSPDKVSVEGYLLYDFRPPTPPNAPEVVTPLTVRVLEMHAATDAAQRGLIGHLASHTRIGCIEYTAAWDDLAYSGLLDMMPPTLERGNALASLEVVPALMARIIDLGRVMEALRPNWAGFHGALALVSQDPLTESGAQAAIVTGISQSLPQVSGFDSTADLPSLPDKVEGEVGVWSQVIVGHLSAREALSLGHLRASTPRAAALAAQLFPRRNPFLPVPDHF